MVNSSKPSQLAQAAKREGTQQRISTMFGDRATKPRLLARTQPLGKGPSVNKSADQKGSFVQQVPSAIVPPATPVAVRKKKWRLSEIVKKERAAREARCLPQPSFVFEAPHMDTRRPAHADVKSTALPGNKTQSKLQMSVAGSLPKKRLREDSAQAPFEAKRACVHRDNPSTTGGHARTANISGGEAIMYDLTMLPKQHSHLLDVLTGLESALSLLRTRKLLPTVASVRDIVTRSTRRTFTLRVLSQLAHLVPEAVAVLPGLGGTKYKKRPSDGLIVRLDDVDMREVDGEMPHTGKMSKQGSILGDSAARVRRSLLHRRLLRHVQDQHALFLERNGFSKYRGESWHPKFNLNKDVEELACPPLYPEEPKVPEENSQEKQANPGAQKTESKGKAASSTESPLQEATTGEGNRHSEDDDAGCIPQGLLDLVRQRAKTKEMHVAKVEEEKTSNSSLLSKLPCTMDTISAVLRGQRRAVMGWSQLIAKVEELHPKKWPKEDLDRQLDVITQLGSDWCKKVALKSSRGGFAFRVISESHFSQARAKVSATRSYTLPN